MEGNCVLCITCNQLLYDHDHDGPNRIDDDHELFILTSAPNFNKLNHFKNTHVQHYLIELI
jgi:hypothetical protein